MNSPGPEPAGPDVEPRRTREFAAELVARLRTWVPGWNADRDAADPGGALLEVSARLLAQVAERLDRSAEKNRRNLYTWLGLRGLAARGARLPIVFKLADSARDAVLASAPVQLQADAAGTSLVFETDADLRLVPARVALVAAVDPVNDRYFLPADGYASLEPAPLLPSSWAVVSLAPAGGALLQLDPPLGLSAGMIIEVGGRQFRITAVNADIVGIEPKIDIASGIAADSVARRVDAFAPFGGVARSRQQHALYFGHADLLNIESTARIGIENALGLSGFDWQYWGKAPGSDASDWQALKVTGAADITNPNALVLEKDTPGAIEPKQLGGVESRWLRASSGELAGAPQPLALQPLTMRVSSAAQPARPVLEGLANTNPLVLDRAFLPLGREPRQFDAFYLGCSEVFAKHKARATLDLHIADSSFASLSALRDGLLANQRLAGVGRDASLHLLSFDPASGAIATLPQRDALQPPAAGGAGTAALDNEPIWRVPIWTESPFSTLVAVVAGRTVWLWRETSGFLPPFLIQSGWVSPSGPPVAPTASSTAVVDALVQVTGAVGGTLYALSGGALYSRAALSTAAWTAVALTPFGTQLQMLAPIAAGAGTLHLVGVDAQGALFAVHDNGNLDALLPAGAASAAVQPIALRRPSDGSLVVVVSNPTRTALTAVEHGAATKKATLALPAQQTVLGVEFDDAIEGSSVVAGAASAALSRALWWSPDYAAAAVQSEAFDAPLGAGAGALSGVPLRMPHHVLVPGGQAVVFELPLLAAGSSGNAPVQLWAQLPPLTTPLAIGDSISVARDGIVGLATVDEPPVAIGVARYLPLKLASTPTRLPPSMLGFRTSQPTLGATIEAQHTSKTDLLLNGATDLDPSTQMILVTVGTTPTLFDVLSVNPGAGPGGATRVVIQPKLPGALNAAVAYVGSVDLPGGSTSTVIRFDDAVGGAPTSNPPNLAVLLLGFSGALPLRRRADVLTRLPDGRPAAALLESTWATPPSANGADEYAYSIEAAPGDWTSTLGAPDSNPELSWEYSNGRSWWQLQNLDDATNNLKTSGKLSFDVPDDIIASDWAGRSNFWIRARLIGGDYGREVFTVTITATADPKVSTQSVTRSTDGVRPPVIVSLAVTYTMHDAVPPEQLLAEDAGTLRNLGDANRTPAASIEAFVPMATQLTRLASAAATPASTLACVPLPASACVAGTSEVQVGAPSSAAGAGSAAAAAPGLALMIGIDGVAEGESIQLLFAIGTEHDHDDCAPLQVEVLVGGRFEPVLAQDATRALGESGIVVLAIAHAPSVTEMFGRALSWLRVSPTSAASKWNPSLVGAWLNAAWVEAAQTQTREVLGSSQGAPSLVVTLARPPLLHATLELRVNEPLGDEEVAALRALDPKVVLTEVDGLPGQWVRWRAVDDVADAAAGARVYALDEATGTVTFGDGLNGMIPPIGRDNIVAFRYRRTEPIKSLTPDTPPPQIAIAALDKLGLITPLEGVEAAIAALASDAGAPADDAARVLRFAPARLRHRERALSAADLEALALQTMPAIAQARCLRAATGAAALRLVVVMRGPQIAPVRAVQRELKRLLLAAMPPGFGAVGSGLALEIVAPKPRRLRVRAELNVATLELAGGVAERAKEALRQRLDPAGGGDDRLGWPLGAAPDAAEIAATLIDTPALDGIEHLTLVELVAAGVEAPWPATLNADELAVLADDGFDFKYLLPRLAA